MFERCGKISAFGLMAGVIALSVLSAEPRVENVRAQQIKDTKDVVVTYDLIAPDGGLFDVSVQFIAPNATPDPKSLSGDVGVSVEPGRNRRLVWNAGTDWPNNLSSNFTCTVTVAEQLPAPDMGMVLVPGGKNSGTDPDFGFYSLTVQSFYMDRTEVTFALWQRVYNWAIMHGYQFDFPGSGKGVNHPVQSIDWWDAVKWCNARSEMEGLMPAYRLADQSVFRIGTTYSSCILGSGGYRLPTSTEWEYAARGGRVGCRFPWGDTISWENANYWGGSGCAWDFQTTKSPHPCFDDGVFPYTAPVASFAANGYGLYDMAGNVWEFCTNVSGDDSTYSRGGSWGSDNSSWGRGDNGASYNCRIGYTNYGYIFYGNQSTDRGFRCVRR